MTAEDLKKEIHEIEVNMRKEVFKLGALVLELRKLDPTF